MNTADLTDLKSDKRIALDRVINILTTDAEDTEKSQDLRTLATELGIEVDYESIDNWIGLTILYADGLNGLVSGEEDYLNDLNDLSKETSLTRESLNDSIFSTFLATVLHVNDGLYGGGVTIYHYQKLCNYLNQSCRIEKFDNALRKLRITQKVFGVRVGISEQGVSKWKRTEFPKWVWYALKGMK